MRNGSSHHQELDVVESLLGDLLGVAETASGQLLEKCLQCLLITLDWLAVNGGSDVSTAIESAIADRLPDDSPNDDDYQSDELFKACKWILALSKHQCVAGDCSRIAELLIASNSSNDCARVDCKRLLQTHCLEASRSDYAIQDEKLLAYYLQTAIRNSDSPLDTMQSLLQLDVHQRLIGSESDQRVALGVYFNVLQSELVKVATAKTLTIDSLLICCAIFKDTLSILKTVETEGLLLDALKYGKQFVDFFTTKALPRLNDPKVIGDSVKSVQTGTRILQVLLLLYNIL